MKSAVKRQKAISVRGMKKPTTLYLRRMMSGERRWISLGKTISKRLKKIPIRVNGLKRSLRICCLPISQKGKSVHLFGSCLAVRFKCYFTFILEESMLGLSIGASDKNCQKGREVKILHEAALFRKPMLK